jgi:hypothetical protein
MEFEEVLEDYRHPDIIMPSGFPVEFDYFYPSLNVAVEYQVSNCLRPS